MNKYNINATMPSGQVATLSFFATDDADLDLNYMFDALYAHAQYNNVTLPVLVEIKEEIIK
jgi:hypothetical protein